MKISVTQKDIAHGVGRDCRNCAVARAIYRTLNRKFAVEVVPYGTMIDDERLGIHIHPGSFLGHPCQHRIACPDEVVEFAIEFDKWYDFDALDKFEREEYRTSEGMDADECELRPEPFEFDLAFEIPSSS